MEVLFFFEMIGQWPIILVFWYLWKMTNNMFDVLLETYQQYCFFGLLENEQWYVFFCDYWQTDQYYLFFGGGGPGRARLGAIIQIFKYYCFFEHVPGNTVRTQIIGQIELRRGKPQIIGCFGKRLILSNNYWTEK